MNSSDYPKSDQLNIAGFYPSTTSMGPGNRSLIWLQGCLKRCKNCITKSMQPLLDKHWINPLQLADFLVEIENIDGITFLGGEPFLQSEALSKLTRRLKETSNLSIMIYTGYTLEELNKLNNLFIEYILADTDILVDGTYEESLDYTQKWRGSENQRIHFLSDRYLDWQWVKGSKGRDVEITLDDQGRYLILGIPPKSHQTHVEMDI